MKLLVVLLSIYTPIAASFVAKTPLSFNPAQVSLSSADRNVETNSVNICPLLPIPDDPSEYAEFAMGCFWGPQRDFDRVEGILDTVVGYSGSNIQDNVNPTYKNILDYAESIRVHYDTTKLTYSDLLTMFFSYHTPANPSWAGSQYRSAIFVSSNEQRELAEKGVKAWGALGKYVSVEDTSDFYRGEEYHQKYLDKMGMF